MLKIYISGPMTGKPNLNREAFSAAHDLLCKEGHLPLNPHDLYVGKRNPTWEDFMRVDIAAMMLCEAMYMLAGWQESKGACIEHDLASQLGFKFIYQA